MFFGGTTRNPLTSKFQLRSTTKSSEASLLTASFDSDDDCVYDSSRVENHQSVTSSQDGSRSAYDFDEYKVQVDESMFTQSLGMLPIPLPCIEPVSTKDIDDTIDKTNDDNSHGKSSSVRFRWNSIRSQFSSAKITDQENFVDDNDRSTGTFKPFFTCGSPSNIIPMMTDTQYKSSDGYDCSDDTSLLHGQKTVQKTAKYFKTSLLPRPAAVHPSSTSTLPSTKKANRSTKSNSDEQYESLIANPNEICNDWIHKQLAFDLEFIESIDINTGLVVSVDDEPHWTLHPDDITFEVPPLPPPPPPPVRSKKSRKKSRAMNQGSMMSDEQFKKMVECYESPSFLDRLLQNTSTGNDSSTDSTFDVHDKAWQNFDAEMRVGYGSSRYIKNYRKITPIVRSTVGRFGRCNGMPVIRESHRRSHTSSRHGGRRRSGRRSSPILLGRQFATNLATVTERPSEEEANSSCIPTPMSNKNRHFFSPYDSDMSSSRSEEGTAETCSSKDSST